MLITIVVLLCVVVGLLIMLLVAIGNLNIQIDGAFGDREGTHDKE